MPSQGPACRAEWRVTRVLAAGKTLPQAEFISAENVKGARELPAARGVDPGGIVGGLRELGYTVELVK